MFIGMELSMIVEEGGFSPLGPAQDVESAKALLEEERPDAAILDINLGEGVTSAPLAEALRAMNVPFVYVSGYDPTYVRDHMPPAPLLSKPVDPVAMMDELRRVLVEQG